jgi:hypothetical protein
MRCLLSLCSFYLLLEKKVLGVARVAMAINQSEDETFCHERTGGPDLISAISDTLWCLVVRFLVQLCAVKAAAHFFSFVSFSLVLVS